MGRTVVLPDTQLTVTEEDSALGIVDGPNLNQLVQGLNMMGAKPSSIIAILQGIKISRCFAGRTGGSMMLNDKRFHTTVLALLISIGFPVQANTQSSQPQVQENDFRSDFLMFDELDELTTGAVRKREEVFKYCLNVSDQAMEARNAVMMKRMAKIEAEVDQKLDRLEERIAVLRTWTERRDEFLARSSDSLIQIFQTMRSDAAALQLTELGPGVAASVVAKLEPKYSSAILAEMKPDDAAKITMILTSAMATDE